MAWSPIKPKTAVVASKDNPNELADPETYLRDSPSIDTFTFVLDIVFASTSENLPTSLAPILNGIKLSDIISATNAKSSPLAAVNLKTPGITSMIWFTLNPANANFSIPAAACSDVKTVLLPKFIASFFNCWNCSFVAPDIASTLLICFSKLKNEFADNPIPTAAVAPKPKTPIFAAFKAFAPAFFIPVFTPANLLATFCFIANCPIACSVFFSSSL